MWRTWFAFETRPGVTRASTQDRTALWRALAESCLEHDGKLRVDEFDRWVEFYVEHDHLTGSA